MAEARKSALPLVRAWSGLDFDGADYSEPKQSALEKAFKKEVRGTFGTTGFIVYRVDKNTDQVAAPTPDAREDWGKEANKKGYTVIVYSLDVMQRIINEATGVSVIGFNVTFFPDGTLSPTQKTLKKEHKDDFEYVLETLKSVAPTTAPTPQIYRFVAYFKYMPTFGRTDEMLKGKLVAELAASQILDDAALSSIDVKDAAYRLVAYAKKVRGDEDQGAGLEGILQSLTEAIRTDNGGTERVDVPVENAIRRALIGKKLIPIRNMLMAKEDQEAGGKPTNIDAPTAEFERDAAAAWATPESARKAMVEMYFTTLGALFSTQQDSKVEIGYVNEADFGSDTSKEAGYVSYGAILYSGRTKNFVEARVTKDSDETRTAVQTVKELFLRNALPINQVLLVSFLEDLSKNILEDFERDITRERMSVLARVENAREIDLPYALESIYYGTASDSKYFGTGSNVAMLTDAAFIAARVLNSLFLNEKFEPNGGQTTGDQDYWKTSFLLKDVGTAAEDITIILNEFFAQILSSYTGHCTVRTADMGRVLGATLVLEPIRKELSKTASKHGYVSMKTVKLPYRNLDPESAVALFYHQIWEKELGNHVVAQGGARLEESHMMAPFLVRVVTDSEHVVPTLCAYDDWIGPTDMFKRIEQTALMEIENYAHSRPSIKYAKGGRGRTLGDVGAWIKTESEDSTSFYMTDLIRKVPEQHRDKAATCCAMLMTAVYAHTAFTEEVRKGGLARQRASETTVRELAARIAKIPV